MEDMMPINNDELVHDNSAEADSTRDHELTLSALETVSAGKPAQSPPPQHTYLKYEFKQVFITSVSY
jgi:hypothetical protein